MAYTGNHSMSTANVIMAGAEGNMRAMQMLGGGLMNMRVQKAAQEEQRKIEMEQLKSAEASTKAMQTLMENNPDAFGGEDAVQNYLMQSRKLGPTQAVGFLGKITAEAGAAAKAAGEVKAERAYGAAMQDLANFNSGMREPYTADHQSRMERVLQQPGMQPAAAMQSVARDPAVAERMAKWITPAQSEPFSPTFEPASSYGGPADGVVFRNSRTSAQLIRPDAGPAGDEIGRAHV